MAVRAKFIVRDYTTSLQDVWTDGKKTGTIELRTVNLFPVTSGSEENKKFYAYTPGGSIQLSTINPEAWNQFEIGKAYYVDFIRAD